MHIIQNLLLTILAGSAGAYIGLRLKLPAGALIGSMVAVLVMNLIWNNAFMPESLRIIIRIAAGALIGSRIQKKDVWALRNTLGSAIVMVVGVLVLSVASGLMVFSLSNLDLATALLASAPGGMSDMSLIADELGADTPKVALLHLVRIMSVLGLFPILLRSVCRRHSRRQAARNTNQEANQYAAHCADQSTNQSTNQSADHCADQSADPALPTAVVSALALGTKVLIGRTMVTLAVGSVGGLLGILAGIPAGAMIGSMLFATGYNILSGKAFVPPKFRRIAQMTIGALIGSSMNMDDVLNLQDIILPGAILIVMMVVLNMCIGYVMHRLTDLDLPTALFSSVPGGLTEMVLIATDFGADTPKVAVLQLLRLMSVIIFFPSLITVLVRLLA
jgi:hypothetical protein